MFIIHWIESYLFYQDLLPTISEVSALEVQWKDLIRGKDQYVC